MEPARELERGAAPNELVVVHGAQRVCVRCALRFATERCPRCLEPPTFERFVRGALRGLALRPAPEHLRGFAAPAPAPRNVAGVLRSVLVVAALTGAGWWVVDDVILRIVVVVGAFLLLVVLLSTLPPPKRAPELAAPSLLKLDISCPFDRTALEGERVEALRGVLVSRGGRRALRWAVLGAVEHTAAAELLGEPLVLRADDGTEYDLRTEGATVVVRGEVRRRRPRQLQVGAALHATGWLRGRMHYELDAIALHDGLRVCVRGEVRGRAGPLRAGGAFRSSAERPSVHPVGGALALEVLA